MDRDYEFNFKKKYLSKLILNGFISAMYCHKTLFKTLHSDNETHGLAIALAHLNESHNYHSNAETFWVDNVELFGDRSELEEIFHRFSVFNNEVLTNARTDHSHQWSDIEYRNYIESFKTVSGLLNIDEKSFWFNKATSE